MTKEQKEGKFSTPQAILVAGALIAGAILISAISKQQLANSPAPSPADAPEDRVAETNDSLKLLLPFEEGVDHWRGASNPSITIYEYSDIDCPFCMRFHETLQTIVSEYPEDVRWVYRHLPLDQLHPEARQKAIMSECVFLQAGEEAFWDLLDGMYEEPSSLAGLPDYVSLYGLDDEIYQECLTSQSAQARISRDEQNAVATRGSVQIGTPWSIIELPDGSRIPFSGAQPTSVVRSVIDAILAQEANNL